MKKLIISSTLIVIVVFFAACNLMDSKKAEAVVVNDSDSVSYYIGLVEAERIKSQLGDYDSLLNKELIAKGYADGLTGAVPTLQGDGMAYVRNYFTAYNEKQIAKEYGEYKIENEKFLAENKTKEGVKVTESGLQYIVLEEGSGESPTLNDEVEVHYSGKLINGTVFDSSYERDAPSKFVLGRVIEGWQEAVSMMKKGAKWQIFVPQEIAYGASPNPQSGILPFSTLIFDIELVSFSTPEANQTITPAPAN